MIDTIGAAIASALAVILAFAFIIAAIEEIRLLQRDRREAREAHDRAVAAAKGRHPSTRPIREDEAQLMRREIEDAKRRQSYRADELMP